MSPITEPLLHDSHGASVPLGAISGRRATLATRRLAQLLCFLSCILLLGALAGAARAEIALPSAELALKEAASKPHDAGPADLDGCEPPLPLAVPPCPRGLHAPGSVAGHAPSFAILHSPARGPPAA